MQRKLDPPAPRTAQEVADLLAASARDGVRKVGLELETGVLREDDFLPAEYEGESGIGLLLERLLDGGSYEPIREEGLLIGLRARDGEAITLEPGGQLELSTRPHDDLVGLHEDVAQASARLARAAAKGGLLLVGGGMQPFAQEQAPWMPKSRYTIMREYFASLGEAGRLAHHMMQRTLSVQVSLDFLSAEDAAEQLRLSFLAAPIMTAIFAASPIDGEAESGLLSTRAQAWLFTDPSRAGEIPACAEAGGSLLDFAEYALDVPMMFRVDGEHYSAQNGASFRKVLEAGAWPDGSQVTTQDLWTHFGGIFTDGRLKKGLVELRSTDGQLPAEVTTIAAMWVGLLYDAEARRAAIDLLSGIDGEARRRALKEAPRFAFSAPWGDTPLIEPARKLVAIARIGLERRIAAGLERDGALEILAPVERRLREGRCPAEELLEKWRGVWGRDRAKLVEAFRFPAE